jgi:hypothetical protein
MSLLRVCESARSLATHFTYSANRRVTYLISLHEPDA